MALSIASFDPEPTEKCAVAAESPKQHDVLVAPALAQYAVEVEPGRTAQVTRIGHQLVAAEITRENFLAGRNGFFGRHLVEAGALPRLLRTFDNECRGIGIELVGVRPDPAVFGLFKSKSEGVVEFLVRAEPDVFAGAHVDIGFEHALKRRSHPGIDAIGADDEVVVAIGVDIFRFGLEIEAHAKRLPRDLAGC